MSDALDRRLQSLAEAVDLADGRLDPESVGAARRVVERAGKRLGFGLEHTIVALAGPTGAGKSSLFNQLADADVADVGRRRPTTSSPTAAVWGDVTPGLLDWLEVPRRHLVENGALAGLVLLDLPDFDSVERGHRMEVDRLIELVDLLVWVVDPQKYADASLHEQYLRPLAGYRESMAVVLNQADVVDDAAGVQLRDDVTQLLRSEDLDGVPVLTASARTGAGVDELRALIQAAVKRRAAALTRLRADVVGAETALASELNPSARSRVPDQQLDQLRRAFAEAAGVAIVARAVDRAHRRRGALAVGWPFTRWLRRFRPDPLRRLRLPETPAPHVRTSLPPPSQVQREQVAAATRALAAHAARELPPPWPNLVRTAATRREDEIADRLDRAVGSTNLRTTPPRWWTAAGFLQKLIALATLTGLVWLLALAVLAWLRLDEIVPVPEINDVPVPTLLLLGGILTGLALAFVFRVVNRIAAARRARAAERALRDRVHEVANELVVQPVTRELETHARLAAIVGQM